MQFASAFHGYLPRLVRGARQLGIYKSLNLYFRCSHATISPHGQLEQFYIMIASIYMAIVQRSAGPGYSELQLSTDDNLVFLQFHGCQGRYMSKDCSCYRITWWENW